MRMLVVTADVTKFIRRYGILSQAFATNTRTFANIRGSIFTHSRHIRGGRRLHSHTFAHIRAHSRDIRAHSRTFADPRTFAHIRAHSRSGPADSQEIREHSRTDLQRFAHIRDWIRRSAVKFAYIRSGFADIHTLLHGSHVCICGWNWSRQPWGTWGKPRQ